MATTLTETECHECGCPLFVYADRTSEEWWCDTCAQDGN